MERPWMGPDFLKESEEDIGTIISVKTIIDNIRQFSPGLSKIIILVEGQSRITIICQKEKDVGDWA